ncbi:MAG: hypothetical protein WCO96_05160 [Actinomycetes bacterium]
MSTPVPVPMPDLDLQHAAGALESVFPLAQIAEQHLPANDPGRLILSALSQSLEAMMDSLDPEVKS